MKKLIFAIALFCGTVSDGHAQNFDDFFTDKTLRIDYVFSGDAREQNISLDGLCSLPGWAGRRHHLAELPLEGNGQITVKSKTDGTVICHTNFTKADGRR